MYLPRNRTSWDLYMLKDRSKDKFYGRSQLVRLRGKYTVQTAHCALFIIHKSSQTPNKDKKKKVAERRNKRCQCLWCDGRESEWRSWGSRWSIQTPAHSLSSNYHDPLFSHRTDRQTKKEIYCIQS